MLALAALPERRRVVAYGESNPTGPDSTDYRTAAGCIPEFPDGAPTIYLAENKRACLPQRMRRIGPFIHQRPASVRSSLAHRLGLERAGLPPTDRRVEGVVAMMLEATQQAPAPLRLASRAVSHGVQWPLPIAGRGLAHRADAGSFRPDGTGRVYYEGAAERLEDQVQQFLA